MIPRCVDSRLGSYGWIDATGKPGCIFISCADESVTLSAGRVATSRSGTESPSRSGSNTACDSTSFSEADHKVFPG